MLDIIFHIDVNSAFLSWTAVEKLKNGSELDIRTIPCIIGGEQSSRHGVVLAASIPAKKYGICTGEPVANAFRKCPKLLMEPPNHEMYVRYSEKLMGYLKSYTPDIEKVSIDECYMDFGGIAHLFESPIEGAKVIQKGVYHELGFTVNIGISTKKVLAKMASDFQKPNKIHTLYPDEIQEKMWKLPVGELYMAGKASVKVLEKLEIHTIGDLAKMDKQILKMHLKSQGEMLWNFANGMDDSKVISTEGKLKNVGSSTTLPQDFTNINEINKVLRMLSEQVGKRLRTSGQKAMMVGVEIKYYDFKSVSHQCQVSQATNTNDVIYQTAIRLFEERWNGDAVRLLGVRTAKLQEAHQPEQLNLFDMSTQKHRKLDAALDQIREKYGANAIHRGVE